MILLTPGRRCAWEHATEDYRPVADIQTAKLHAESRDNIGAWLRANSVVEVEIPDHLAILIRQLVEAEQTVSAPLLGGGGGCRSAGSV